MGVDVVSILLPYKQGEMLYAAPHGALPYCFARTNGTSKFFYDEVLRQIGTAIVVPNTQAFSTLLGANIYAELKIHTTVAAAILGERVNRRLKCRRAEHSASFQRNRIDTASRVSQSRGAGNCQRAAV